MGGIFCMCMCVWHACMCLWYSHVWLQVYVQELMFVYTHGYGTRGWHWDCPPYMLKIELDHSACVTYPWDVLCLPPEYRGYRQDTMFAQHSPGFWDLNSGLHLSLWEISLPSWVSSHLCLWRCLVCMLILLYLFTCLFIYYLFTAVPETGSYKITQAGLQCVDPPASARVRVPRLHHHTWLLPLLAST